MGLCWVFVILPGPICVRGDMGEKLAAPKLQPVHSDVLKLCAIKIWSYLPPAGPLPNNRLQATVGGLGVDMPARRAFAPRA